MIVIMIIMILLLMMIIHNKHNDNTETNNTAPVRPGQCGSASTQCENGQVQFSLSPRVPAFASHPRLYNGFIKQ